MSLERGVRRAQCCRRSGGFAQREGCFPCYSCWIIDPRFVIRVSVAASRMTLLDYVPACLVRPPSAISEGMENVEGTLYRYIRLWT